MNPIHVKVGKETKEKLEHLVRAKIYKNTSEAVRKMLKEHMAEHPELFVGEELKELATNADKISDEEFRERLAEGLRSTKPIAQLLAEQRDRFT